MGRVCHGPSLLWAELSGYPNTRLRHSDRINRSMIINSYEYDFLFFQLNQNGGEILRRSIDFEENS